MHLLVFVPPVTQHGTWGLPRLVTPAVVAYVVRMYRVRARLFATGVMKSVMKHVMKVRLHNELHNAL